MDADGDDEDFAFPCGHGVETDRCEHERELLIPSVLMRPSFPRGSTDESQAAVSAFGAKTIGLWGGVMLLINNVAGPTVASMPALTQQAGWLAMLLVMILIATLSACCGFLMIAAMRAVPGNGRFEKRVEFTDLIRFYLTRPTSDCVMGMYHVYLILTLMTYIIQSAQVIDYMLVDIWGCAPGIALSKPFGPLCGTQRHSITPFGDTTVLSSSMVAVAIVCAPLATLNLDDNIALQWVAIIGLTGMAIVWSKILVEQPTFPDTLPWATTAQGSLVGTVLFNFAFMSAVPSWVNEKRPEVPVGRSFLLSLGYVVFVYSAIGILGGAAFRPFYTTDQNLFSKMNASGSIMARFTVAVYPILQNFTTIPVLAILIRYNLQSSGLSSRCATVFAFGLPWILSIPFYSGEGFNTIATLGGLVTSSAINFIVPVWVYAISQRTPSKIHCRAGMTSAQ